MATQQVKAGVPFTIGGIACCKCPRCGVTRELARFYKPSGTNLPAAAREMICDYCR